MRKKYKKTLIVLFPLIFIVVFYTLKTNSWEQYTNITKEDSYLEYLQAITYFITAGICIYISVKNKKLFKTQKIILSLIALIILIVALEEISWGQRLLQIETPEYFQENNVQYEVSVHNLKPIQSILHQAYIALGFLGAVVLPIIRSLLPTKSFFKPILPTFLTSTYFGSVAIFYILLHFAIQASTLVANYINWQDQEVFETLLALGIFITVLRFRNNLKV